VLVCVAVDPLYSKVQENLTKKHEEEKEGVWLLQSMSLWV